MEAYLAGLVALAVGACVWPFLAQRNARLTGWLSAAVPAYLFAWLWQHTGNVASGDLPRWSADWVPQLGVRLDFLLDGPGLLLSLLITGIGALIMIYGGGYLRGQTKAVSFFAFNHVFMLAMLGVAVSDNLLLLFVFWELTSLASYFLIGLSHGEKPARDSALRALIVTGAGGLAMLAGILLLGAVGGTFTLSELQGRGDIVRASVWYTPIFILIVLGAFTKSAQMPFHFWLPDAMVAPTPVSAYLHSATMVKAGVFLLAKMTPVLGGTVLWHDTLTVFGAVTMFVAAVIALAQTDIKRLLAYSTLSALGTLVLLLGIGTELAVKAAMVFLVVHALYKAPLFMVAGVVDKAAGTRNITLLHGLGRHFPLVAIAAALAAFSMSGVPPFIGFIGKELLYEAQTDAGNWSVLITTLGFAANAVNVTVALKVGVSPFRRRGTAPEVNPEARQWSLLIGPLLLAVAGALIGIFPTLLGEHLVNPAARDILRTPVAVHLHLWHGFNSVLLLSAVTVLLGVILYALRNKVRLYVWVVVGNLPVTASAAFDAALAAFLRGANRLTHFFQHGNLRLYIAVMLLSLSALIAAALATTGWVISPQGSPLRLVPLVVCILIVVAGLVAIRSRSTVMAVVAMGGVGFGIALLFAVFGAPDLALTQVLVETLTLVLFALIMRSLPGLRVYSDTPKSRRITDLGIAVVAGVALTLALLAVRSAPSAMEDRVSAAMTARSLPDANGRNVVNVILVDFRALDTMGEICVLAIAALGVAGLLVGPHRRNLKGELAIATPLYRTSVAWLGPLMIFLSVILLFRGHNEPGGGFIGGLVAGAGLVLRRLATASHPPHASQKPVILIALGLATALISALPSLLVNKSFMEGIWAAGTLWLPFVGKTKFGTPFLFDCGVYLVVIGVILLILTRVLRSDSGRAAGSGEAPC